MSLPNCPKCQSEYIYEDGDLLICPECSNEWKEGEATEEVVAIKDANNCVKIFNGVVAITQPSAITASYCYNAPAKILHIAPAGGVTPYKFSLDGVTYIPSNANDGGRDVIGVNPGTYTVFLTASGPGGSTSTQVTIVVEASSP